MNIRNRIVWTSVVVATGLLLAACGGSAGENAPSLDAVAPAPETEQSPQPAGTSAAPAAGKNPTAAVPETQAGDQPAATGPDQSSRAADLLRTDAQGAVEVAVTPKNLPNPTGTLDFDVSMNTHSVELSMDLAALSTLTTDTGQTVQARGWDAPSGGHHVEGTLSFPAEIDGTPLLEGATQLTLTIRDVDVPERVFTWPLP